MEQTEPKDGRRWIGGERCPCRGCRCGPGGAQRSSILQLPPGLRQPGGNWRSLWERVFRAGGWEQPEAKPEARAMGQRQSAASIPFQKQRHSRTLQPKLTVGTALSATGHPLQGRAGSSWVRLVVHTESSKSGNKADGKKVLFFLCLFCLLVCFYILDDITCILNNNETINYRKLNQKNLYVEFGVFINE